MDPALRAPIDIATLEAEPPLAPWLWPNFLAPGLITLFTSRWKAGKTTLISLILQRMEHGGTLAGGMVRPGNAIIVSEESESVWAERHRRLHFGRHIRWHCRPFSGRPSPRQWCELVGSFASFQPSLVIIDPLSVFLPGNIENCAAEIQNAFEPLRNLAQTGPAILLLHHPSKTGGLTPRGSGALASYSDIISSLDTLNDSLEDRRRRFRITSRLAPPVHRVIELTEDGFDYRPVAAEPPSDRFELGWPLVRAVLADASTRLTRKQILQQWPEDFERPSAATLWRWLKEAVSRRLATRRGTGRPRNPYTYALPGFVPAFPDIPPLEDPLRRRKATSDLEKELARSARAFRERETAS